MSSRRRRLDPVGPFGNPDGSRADIEDVLSEFVDFGGNPAYGHLATRANDSKVRVIVGKLGAGKTVYLRRLQDFQSHQDSVYADVPQQSLPKTEVIVKACQWFSDSVLVEKWMQIWERAIMRALASHLLRRPELRQQLRDEQADELERSYARLISDSRRPRSIYSEVRDIINERNTAHQLSAYLDDPLWDDLEDLLGEVIGQCKPVYFYLDAIDEEFSHAPMYWLRCQEGLFYQVMRLLRDHKLGGRLHVVVCIRDIVMSSVYRSEHAPRYYNEPHIRVLTWDRISLLYLLGQKLQRLPPSLLMRRAASGPPSIRDWLGIEGDWNGPDGDGTIEDYLLHHTRLIPRDIISLGNELSEEVLRQKQAGRGSVPHEAIEAVVQRSAKRFGDSQLAQCANQISSDLMPQGAALHDYSELFTSTQAYISGTQEDVRSFVRMIGVDRFSRGDLDALQEVADLHFERATNLATVLWQNGLLGYIDEAGRRRYYSMGDIEQFHFPPEVDTYVLHPCLVYAVGGIRHVPEGTADRPPHRAVRARRAQRPFGGGGRRVTPARCCCRRRRPRCCLRAFGPGLRTGFGVLASGRSQGLPEPDPEEVRSSAGTKPRDYAVGDIIDGRFEILQVVGRGGFSKVYRVRDDVEDEERAIKLFDNAAGYQAVRREIGALRKIQHPNVVKVFWAGKTRDGEWYLITEFLDGESLDEFATGRRSLRDREAVDVALDLLDALVAFHPDAARIKQLEAQRQVAGDLTEAESRELADLQNSGLVHRDIKPLNVVLTRTGAKLLDFNIASRVGDPVHTQSGTPPYQPPDAGLDRWDVSTDLFAVGVLLYRLLGNGHHPFPHAMPMAGVPVTDPRTIRPDLDRALAGFLVTACAPASADRFATAAEMRVALREIRAGLLSLPSGFQPSTTARIRHWSGTPFSSWEPRSSNCRPDPATRSRTVELTRTSLAPARADTRAPMWTAMPRTASPATSTSPVCRPARISMPSERTARTAADAHRTARPGPSNTARKPSPAVSTSRPRKRASSPRTSAWWRSSRSPHLPYPAPIMHHLPSRPLGLQVQRTWRSACRPGAELVGVADGPDVLDPVAVDVEREHRHGDAVLLGYQAGLAVDRALQDRHVSGAPFGQVDNVARDLLAALDRVQRGGGEAAAVGGHGGAGVEEPDEGADVLGCPGLLEVPDDGRPAGPWGSSQETATTGCGGGRRRLAGGRPPGSGRRSRPPRRRGSRRRRAG